MSRRAIISVAVGLSLASLGGAAYVLHVLYVQRPQQEQRMRWAGIEEVRMLSAEIEEMTVERWDVARGLRSSASEC